MAPRPRRRGSGLAECPDRPDEVGVDWSEGTDQGDSAVRVEVSTSQADNTGTAGEAFNLRVRVTNEGQNPLFQLRVLEIRQNNDREDTDQVRR